MNSRYLLKVGKDKNFAQKTCLITLRESQFCHSHIARIQVSKLNQMKNKSFSMVKKIYLGLELLLLFGVVPALLYFDVIKLYEILTLLIFFALIFTMLVLDSNFDKRQLFTFKNLKPYFQKILIRFLLSAIILTAITLIFIPDIFLGFVRGNLKWWMVIMIFYPMISVYPQELIYRVFMFHRYRSLLNHSILRILMSALAFSWMHIVFDNVYAVVLSFFGGLIFAYTYEKTRSIGVVAIEHAIYGDFIFTIGLGTFFYKGFS